MRFLSCALLLGALTGLPTGTPAQLGSGNPTVTVSVISQQDGQTLSPGAPVKWILRADVSQGDNLGLALVTADFEQDENNPFLFDIPTGRGITSTMRAFDHPEGFTNPGEFLRKSGFGGTRVGTPGQRNLAQIGGAQNTFGFVPAALGQNGEVERGLDINVDTGVGQGPNGQRFASGNFRAPNLPGTYTFRVSSVTANVLTEVNAPPVASKVMRADTVIGASGSFTFTVQ